MHLRHALKLPNDQVAEALKERCVRIEKKFGNLMLNPDGAIACSYSSIHVVFDDYILQLQMI